MKNRLVLKTISAVCILATVFTAGTYAASGLSKVEVFLREDFSIKINGESAQLSTPPVVYEGKTYLPVSEISSILGADVKWDAGTKTIFIDPRLYEIQPEHQSSELEEIEISYLNGMSAKYLGKEYPLLVNNTNGGTRYLREKDLRRMGVNTSGLIKVREKWTNEIYIAEEEAKKAWKEAPDISYSYNTRIAVTEEDKDKADVLRSFRPWNPLIPGLPIIKEEDENNYYSNQNYQQHDFGILYTVDPVPDEENTYLALYFQDNKYYYFKLTLSLHEFHTSKGGKSIKETSWYVSEYSSELIYDIEEQYRKNYYPY